MSRLAFFSPWPPQPSGIATCAADIVPALAAAGHGIDVFVDEALVPVTKGEASPPASGEIRVLGAHDFVWRHARAPYDLPIYQAGNSWAHGFIWPYLFQHPGLVVLHDARLHHARADALLSRRRTLDYRAEFAYNHPGVPDDAAELAIAGFDGAYYYHWPMRGAVMDASRLVATHSRGAVKLLRDAHPDRAVEYIALGHGVTSIDASAARRAFRSRTGIPDDALVFGVLGTAAPEKRIAQIIRAFASTRQWAADARLLFAGQVDPLLPLDEMLDAFGIRDVTHVAGRLTDSQFDEAVVSCDVGLNLRWPTAREVSGPWLRMLSAGLPTVVVDAAHHVDVPTLDPRTWLCHAPGPLAPNPEARAVAVGIDILDEDHSLRLALRRLGSDAALRLRLGAAARAYWESNHTVAAMAADYERAIALAQELAAPVVDLPAHLRPDPLRHTREVIGDLLSASPI
ncbi:MAG TPA: glycosyltransferase family 4 protein [Vicinamibacterales bacterium]|nr:glycosyltransferase family 4 protein [Vicinamibacterales bacterium]